MSTDDWRHDAACLDTDPELFFPVGTTPPALAQTDEAKAVCARCDVVDQCRTWALDTRQEYGVWGGLSEAERRTALRRARPSGRPEARRRGTAPTSASQRIDLAVELVDGGMGTSEAVRASGCSPSSLYARLVARRKRQGAVVTRAEPRAVDPIPVEPEWLASAHRTLIELDERVRRGTAS